MSSRKITLVLTELILVIFILAVSSAYCLSVFANASQKTAAGENMRLSAIAAQIAAECWKSAGGDADEAAAKLGSCVVGFALVESGEALIKYTDENFEISIESADDTSARLRQAKISVFSDGAELYTLDICAVAGGES